VDKYTNPTNPGESALQEAKRLQEQGAAAIYTRVQQRDNPNQAKPTVYTRTLDSKGTKQNVMTGEIIPPEKKIIASPTEQRTDNTAYSPYVVTSPGALPPVTFDTLSTSNNLPPAKGTLQGTINQNIPSNLAQNLKALQAQTPMLQALGLGNLAKTINQMVQQLAPGVTARISAKGARRR
jgi:hypothetical protein